MTFDAQTFELEEHDGRLQTYSRMGCLEERDGKHGPRL